MKSAKQSRGQPSLNDLPAIYTQLAEFNRHCVSALDLIEVFRKLRLVPDADGRYHRASLEELRALLTLSALEQLSEKELALAGSASRSRTKAERQIHK